MATSHVYSAAVFCGCGGRSETNHAPSQVFVRLQNNPPLELKPHVGGSTARSTTAYTADPTRRPFWGGSVGWEAAAGGRVPTPERQPQGLVAHRKIKKKIHGY
eukprot:scaffold2065_cov114-Isochrysis_galbana.AAC.1